MKILVTGGTGFVGSYLLIELLKAGHEVAAVRRPGSTPAVKLEVQPGWIEIPFNELSLANLADIDVIIHLASSGVSPKQSTWLELEKVNVLDSLRLMQLACQCGVRRMIVSGTCLEYGLEADAWEQISPQATLRPVTPYGASKAAGFLLLNAFARLHSIEFFYGRIFNAFGKGQYEKNLWPSLQKAALEGADFLVKAGNQIRDFISVEEVARCFRVAAERDDLISSQPFIVNVGSGKATSVHAFAQDQWLKLGAAGSLLVNPIASKNVNINRIVADTTLMFPED